MLTLQCSQSRIVCLLMVKVKQDSLGDVILFTSQGVSFKEVQEGLNEQGISESCMWEHLCRLSGVQWEPLNNGLVQYSDHEHYQILG